MPRYLYYDENGTPCKTVPDTVTFAVLLLANVALIGGIWYFCHYKGWL